MSLAVDQNPSSIVIVDREGRILHPSAKCLASSGYSPEDVAGKTPRIFKSGSLYWESAVISPIRDDSGTSGLDKGSGL